MTRDFVKLTASALTLVMLLLAPTVALAVCQTMVGLDEGAHAQFRHFGRTRQPQGGPSYFALELGELNKTCE
ncbi:MAG: hypothetical protein ACREKS_06930 [Candidatus Rokuibacteriota bacterium]